MPSTFRSIAETGVVDIAKITFVADTGTVINPVAFRGQVDGGFMFGFGHAMTEELIVEDGRIVNLSLADYKLPSMRDIPPFRSVFMDDEAGPGPFGAKSAGELNTAGVRSGHRQRRGRGVRCAAHADTGYSRNGF